ncbi:MAG: L,D-transpeptidase [Pseudomonadaceae bacterium]|nr:L,D-transpeptidase [Pseudomonadaceae bacterium]
MYLHGTGDDQPMGIPLSHGCIRLRNSDMLALFDMTPAGCAVVIE